MAFIRTHRLGFETLEAAEFAELQPLLAKVEIACGNRDFGLALQQGFVPGAFFKVPHDLRRLMLGAAAATNTAACSQGRPVALSASCAALNGLAVQTTARSLQHRFGHYATYCTVLTGRPFDTGGL